MAFFLTFATMYSGNAGSEDSKEFSVNFTNHSILRLLPICSFYDCENLFRELMVFISKKPELSLLVEAEKCAQRTIEWDDKVIAAIIDEVLSKPKSVEKIEVKKGFLRHEERGDLNVGMLILAEKGELLKKLTSSTVLRIMQQVRTTDDILSFLFTHFLVTDAFDKNKCLYFPEVDAAS